MNIIKFKFKYTSACRMPDHLICESDGDVEGDYVLASEANERIKVLEDALKLEREECAKIAEKYEPDEKLDYVTYASREIRLRCAALEVK